MTDRFSINDLESLRAGMDAPQPVEGEPQEELAAWRPGKPIRRANLFSDLDLLGYEELLEAKEENLQRLAECKSQEVAAQERQIQTGEYADGDWWKRLMGAIKVFGLRDQAIATRLRRAKLERAREFQAQIEERRSARVPGAPNPHLLLPQQFVNVAEERLDPELFQEFMEAARVRVGDEVKP